MRSSLAGDGEWEGVMTDTPTTTTDPSEMPTHLSEAAKQRDEKRKAEELSQLATKAKEAHLRVVNAPRVVLQHAITAGHALNEAKNKVGHGKWLAWLKENCPDISDRTAERYMKLAEGQARLDKKLEDKAKFDIVSNLTINEALRLIDEPDGEQSASAEVQQTGDAVCSSPSSSGGKGKGKNKKKQTEPTAEERREQIENFETEWQDGLTDWQKHHFAKKFCDELSDLLRDVEAELGVDEEQQQEQAEEAEAQPSLS
jgi:hypothetical protein